MAMDQEQFKFPDEKGDEEVKKVEGEETEIEVIDDTPPDDQNRKPLGKTADEIAPDEEVKQYGEQVQQRIKELKRGYHDERRAKEEALREREEAVKAARYYHEQAKKLSETVTTTVKESAEMAKGAAEVEISAAESELEKAYESGDAKAVAKATRAIAEAQAKLARALVPPQQALQPQFNGVQSPPSDQPRPDPKAQRWQQANEWFGKDDEMTSFVLGLHRKLVRQGVDPTSDEYYAKVDARMREVFPDQFGEEESPPPKASSKPAATVVAPPSRSSAPKKITITKSQAALAQRLGISVQEYARQVQLLESRKNG